MQHIGEVVVKRKRPNAPTMVVVRVPIRGGLLMVRRAADGDGEPLLPGGYQKSGETWQEAGAREVRERTGVAVEPSLLRLLSVVTAPDRRQNLIFCQSDPAEHAGAFDAGQEVAEVLVSREPVEAAVPLHTHMVADFFRHRSPGA